MSSSSCGVPVTVVATLMVTTRLSTSPALRLFSGPCLAPVEPEMAMPETVGLVMSRTRVGLFTLLVAALPTASISTTVATPPEAIAACNSALVGVPSEVVKLTLVSPAAMLLSVATVAPLIKSRALPPVASPATIVALAVRLVLLRAMVLGSTVPPAGVSVTAVGAVGARVSMLMLRVPALLVLPAASVWVTLSVSAPCPMAAMSSVTRV